jgi:YihY family inner membrane protein
VRRHRLTTHANAIAFRVLVSLVPLALLGIGLLGTFGLEDAWTDSISPTLHRHLQPSAAVAADDIAEGVFNRKGAGLLALSSALVIWNTLRAIREVEHALEEIHEKEGRPRPLLAATALRLGLACFVDVCLFGAFLVFVVAPRLVDEGGVHDALAVGRWVVALGLLWLAVTALVRYAPSERPQTSWASGGSALIVGGWLLASTAFGAWSAYVASYKTAIGMLTAFLVLTAYTLTVAHVFVLGAQLDETLRRRERSSRGSRG